MALLPVLLPVSYVRQATMLNLYGVSIGFFALWPTFDRKSNLVDALTVANLANDEVVRNIRSREMLIVGRQEANWICIDVNGLVFRIDITSCPEPTFSLIARDFEVFLLLIGNLHEISEQNEGNPVAGAEEMRKCCIALSCDHVQYGFWERMAMDMSS